MASAEPKIFSRRFVNINPNYIQPVAECFTKSIFQNKTSNPFEPKPVLVNPQQTFTLELDKSGSLSGIDEDKWIYIDPKKLYPDRGFEPVDKSLKYNSLKDLRNKYGIQDTSFDFTDNQLNSIQSDFEEWCKRKYYGMFLNTKTKQTHFRELAKRGNSKYRKVLMAKLLTHFEFMNNPEFANNFLIRKIHKKGFRDSLYSNVFFITLTTDPKLSFNNKKRAWTSESKEMNLFLTNVRKQYGKIEYLSVVESTKKAYPHNHLLIILEKPQKVFFDKKESIFRMNKKDHLSKYWHSFIDVSVPGSAKVIIDYLFKDMLKSTTRDATARTDQDNLTMALQWIFRKQSYSNSSFSTKGFLGKYLSHDLTRESITQTSLKQDIGEFSNGDYIFLGITCLKWKDGYDPPEKFKLNLNKYEIDKYCLIRFDKKLEKKEDLIAQSKQFNKELKEAQDYAKKYLQQKKQPVKKINSIGCTTIRKDENGFLSDESLILNFYQRKGIELKNKLPGLAKQNEGEGRRRKLIDVFNDLHRIEKSLIKFDVGPGPTQPEHT